MTLDEFYALMTDAEATKKITLQNIDAENPEKEYTNIYADFTYPRSIGKQCVTKVNYATGEPAEEVHLVASLEVSSRSWSSSLPRWGCKGGMTYGNF